MIENEEYFQTKTEDAVKIFADCIELNEMQPLYVYQACITFLVNYAHFMDVPYEIIEKHLHLAFKEVQLKMGEP